jgi:hypothetical protein
MNKAGIMTVKSEIIHTTIPNTVINKTGTSHHLIQQSKTTSQPPVTLQTSICSKWTEEQLPE